MLAQAPGIKKVNMEAVMVKGEAGPTSTSAAAYILRMGVSRQAASSLKHFYVLSTTFPQHHLECSTVRNLMYVYSV